MPQFWIRTRRKRFMLATLNIVARIGRWLFDKPRAGARSQKDHIRSVLVIEPWNIGDIILAMPFLAQVRARFPEARITMLAQPVAAEILAGTGLVDDFIPAKLTWVPAQNRASPQYDWRELRRLRKELRARQFDVAFSCRLHVREHLLLGLSGATRRVGYTFGGGDALLTDPVAVDDPYRQKADDWIRLLEPFGRPQPGRAPRLLISEAESARANELLSSRGISMTDVVVGIHPGASLVEKRWPLESFREVATALAARSDLRVVVFVEPSSYGDSLADIPGVASVKVGLRDLIALIGRCDLLVCNDSGPMHLAGALNVPTVAAFGAGIDRWYSPLGEGHEAVAAQPAQRSDPKKLDEAEVRSPAAVPVSEVLAAIHKVLQRRRVPATFSRA